MAVEIAGTPTLASNGPGFAGITIAVPLSEAPTEVWLDLLALGELPGKGHRLRGATLEMHLDRDAHDVMAAMRKVESAIQVANEQYAEYGKQLEAGAEKADQIGQDARAKIERLLERWWSERPSAAPVPAAAVSREAVSEAGHER